MIGTCECCEFENVEVKEYDPPALSRVPMTLQKEKNQFCLLCASTHASTRYTSRYSGGADTSILQAICFVGNAILKKLEEPNHDTTKDS